MALHHIAVMKSAGGSPKIILDAGLVMDMKPKFSGFHIYLTWILLVTFYGDIWKPRPVPVQSVLETGCGF